MADEEYGGPWLQAAAFCEKVLQENDGVLSLVRLVDRFIITSSGPGAPEKMPPTTLTVHAVIALKSGFAKSSGEIRLVGRTPSQQEFTRATLPVFLEGDDRGINANLELVLQMKEEGLYWFDVFFGERLMTRMPLRVLYQRLMPGPGTQLIRGGR